MRVAADLHVGAVRVDRAVNIENLILVRTAAAAALVARTTAAASATTTAAAAAAAVMLSTAASTRTLFVRSTGSHVVHKFSSNAVVACAEPWARNTRETADGSKTLKLRNPSKPSFRSFNQNLANLALAFRSKGALAPNRWRVFRRLGSPGLQARAPIKVFRCSGRKLDRFPWRIQGVFAGFPLGAEPLRQRGHDDAVVTGQVLYDVLHAQPLVSQRLRGAFALIVADLD